MWLGLLPDMIRAVYGGREINTMFFPHFCGSAIAEVRHGYYFTTFCQCQGHKFNFRNLLHSEWPYRVLAILSAEGLLYRVLAKLYKVLAILSAVGFSIEFWPFRVK